MYYMPTYISLFFVLACGLSEARSVGVESTYFLASDVLGGWHFRTISVGVLSVVSTCVFAAK